jgi:hypothetical protein
MCGRYFRRSDKQRLAEASAHAEFSTLSGLRDALDVALPAAVLDLQSTGSIIFAGEMALDDGQLRALGLA